MNIDIRDIITLDDTNKYVVASKVLYEEINYYYLINVNNLEDILFCYEDNSELVELDNNELITKLLPLFYKETRNILNEYKEDY